MAKRKTESEGEPRRYTFKLYPNKTQEGELHRQARMMAELWNALLQRNEDIYRRTRGQKGVVHSEGKPALTYYDMTNEITQLRQSCPEWESLSVWCGHRVARALSEAFAAFYRRMAELSNPANYERQAADFRARKGRNPTRFELAGYPKYRATLRAVWVPHRFQSGCKLTPHGSIRERPNGRKSHCNWRLKLKGIAGEIRARGEFPSLPLDWSDADIRHYDQHWWLSVGVETNPELSAGEAALTIRFNLLDKFVEIEGADLSGPDFTELFSIQDQLDALKSERDRRWPYKPWQRPSCAQREANRRISRLSAHVARARRELLHVWSTAIVSNAKKLTIIAPSIKQETRSGRGNERSWGAATGVVAEVNRRALAQAPASAIQMLKYKADQAGIPCEVIHDSTPNIAIGRDISAARKLGRRASRDLKRNAM